MKKPHSIFFFKIKLIHISLVILCAIILSCNANINSTSLIKSDTLKIKEFKILDRKLYFLINKNKEDFKKKYDTNPNVIVVSVSKSDNFYEIRLVSKMYLEHSKTSKELHYNNLFASAIIDKTLIVIDGVSNKNYLIENSFISIKNKIRLFKINYGGDMNFCTKEYKILKNEFILYNSFCFGDFYKS